MQRAHAHSKNVHTRAQDLRVRVALSCALCVMCVCERAQVGAVTSSVLNTLKRVIIIVVTAVIFGEVLSHSHHRHLTKLTNKAHFLP